MADSQAGRRLHTLSEIAQRTGISMPTLQRYKKLYQSRIPSVGKGRKQRYPDEALPVFEQLKVENAGRRGRPRKNAAAPRAMAGSTRGRAAAASTPARRGPGRPRKAAAAPVPAPAPAAKRRGRPPGRKNAAPTAPAQSGLLTLTEISNQTNISYPTLVRYVKLHSNRLPSEGKGRTRRYYPAAVEVFRELRSQSGRGGRKPGPGKRLGRPPGRRGRPPASSAGDGATAHRLKILEKAQQDLEKKFRGFAKSLQRLFR